MSFDNFRKIHHLLSLKTTLINIIEMIYLKRNVTNRCQHQNVVNPWELT